MKKHIIALGAENKNTFSGISEKGLFVSKPVEDLQSIDNINNFEESIKTFMKDNLIKPDYIACDFHPEYTTTHLAKKLHSQEIDSKLIQVQHHFAHIVSCMYDNDIDEKVIGISFDGTGYGTDGNIWGAEFMLTTRKAFYRLNHLKYVAQPGGDIATRQGWRMAVSYLMQAFGDDFKELDLPIFETISEKEINITSQMIKKSINSPFTSSAGRLFDAISSILGICNVSEFEAEAAMLLEKEIAVDVKDYYSYKITPYDIDLSVMIREIVDDVEYGEEISLISSKFHNTLGEIIFDMSMRIHSTLGIDKVLISGGCFQNKYLRDYLIKRFKESKLMLYTHNKYSTTDLGISVGQAAVCDSIGRY